MAVLKHKKWLFVVLVVGVLFWAVPSLSLATEKQWLFGLLDLQVFPYKLQVPLGSISSVDSDGDTSALGVYISELYKFFVSAAAIVAVVSIMFAGLQRITSQGNPEMISKSNEQITQALFGLAIALLSYVILNTINPQLLRLDALKIENVNYSAISVTSGDGLCPSSPEVVCGRNKPASPGPPAEQACWGLSREWQGNLGLDEVCEIQSGGNFSRGVQTALLSKIEDGGKGAEIISALLDAGWWNPGFYILGTKQVIYPKWCADKNPSDSATEQCKSGSPMPCGVIQYKRRDPLAFKATYVYYLGTYCATVKNVRPSCVINLAQVKFIPSDPNNTSEGTIVGATCQTIN